MARIFTNKETGVQINTKCINHMTTTTISNKFTQDRAILEIIRQLDMGELHTDLVGVAWEITDDYTGYVYFNAMGLGDDIDGSYALSIDKFIERTDYYQITFSLYKSI